MRKYHTEKFSIAEDIILTPRQEQTYNLLLHNKKLEQGKEAYVLCNIQYNSVEKPNKDKRTFHILNLYKISHIKSYTDMYSTNLIRSADEDCNSN